ncbi:hypothetical protein Tco_0338736 [Tanacetum coccineum]
MAIGHVKWGLVEMGIGVASHFVMWYYTFSHCGVISLRKLAGLVLEGVERINQKESQNQARNGKDKVKGHPSEENIT